MMTKQLIMLVKSLFIRAPGSRAYEKGYASWYDGSHCPYRAGSAEEKDWQAGHDDVVQARAW